MPGSLRKAPSRPDATFAAVVEVTGWPRLLVRAATDALISIETLRGAPPTPCWPANGWHARILADIQAALNGAEMDWSYVPLRTAALSRFTGRVVREIRLIPHGAVRTYGEIARRIRRRGAKASARAVGRACGANPWPLVAPCHRVVAASGIGGFGWGVEWKRRLLAMEGVLL